MSEEKIESSIRDFIDALEEKDVDRALSFFADDATWYAPEGDFKGKDEIRRYITWLAKGQQLDLQKFEDTGIGILVKGNEAVYEYTWVATFEGTRIRAPGVCIYRFKDGKCFYHRAIYDRLGGAQQGVKGWFGKRAVNAIVENLEKGLH